MTAPAPPPFVELTARLARYPADRYPVQHATASFQLGFALTGAGRFDEAERALAVAVELFGPDRLPTEHAKALNARGAALRAAGRPAEAAECFQTAATGFEALDLPLEHGAALFNLGLVRRELGTDPIDCFERSRTLLDADRVPSQAAAATRELGAAMLTADRVAESVPILTEAVGLADRAGDLAGLGAAANTLGLAQLAQGRTAEAIEALGTASGAHPRTLRPEGHSMAKANLALAHEQAGDVARARLAAHQALGVPGVPEVVCAAARGVLTRLGGGPGALFDVLDTETDEQWPALFREELLRWTDAWPDDRAAEADALISAVIDRPVAAAELVAVWLGALLEMPPVAMEGLAADVLAALRGRDAAEVERFRSLVARGCARFYFPQMNRLTQLFEQLAAEHGGPKSWR